jgi:hypothetical protein
VALALKEAQVLFTQFIQTGPLHRFSLLNRLWRSGAVFMLLWQRGGTVKKTKSSPHPKRDEGCLCIKLRGTTQIAKDKMCPLPLSAH